MKVRPGRHLFRRPRRGHLPHRPRAGRRASRSTARNVLVFDSALQYQIQMVQGVGMFGGGLFNCVFTGQGRLAITTKGTPVVIPVDQPTYVDTEAAIGWSANLQTGYHRAERSARMLRGGSTGEVFTMSVRRPGLRDRPASEERRRRGRRRRRPAAAAGRPARRPARRLTRTFARLRGSCAAGLRMATTSAKSRRSRPGRRRGAGRARPASAKSASGRARPGADGGWSPAPARGIRAEEPHVGADPAQAHQRLAHPGLGDVAGAVEEERVPAEPLAGRPRLDPGQVDPAHGQLGEHREQRADPVVARCRPPAWSGRRRSAAAAGRAGSPARTGSSRRGGRRCPWPARSSRLRVAPIGAQIAASYSPVGRADARRPRWTGRRPRRRRARASRSQLPALGGRPAGAPRPSGSRPAARSPGAPSTNCTGSTTSRVITSGSPVASSSRVTPTAPADRVLQRHQGRVGVAVPDRVERLGHAARGDAGAALGGRDRPQGLLGEGAFRTEVDESGAAEHRAWRSLAQASGNLPYWQCAAVRIPGGAAAVTDGLHT